MELVVDFLTRWLTAAADSVASVTSGVISVFDWPAQVIGIPPELLATATLCLALIGLWRAMGGYFT